MSLYSAGALAAQPEEGLKRGHRRFATVVPEHELIQVDLQLIFADAMVGSDQL